ncbi:hybrid sensor histidine kinase/response regulator [Halosimplex pelagicum]|uniref:histidine kinase n=1 Tax=Halosimplex pelagicum TaxID=869886 RepID=A0A7D5T916_9EURY|nr:PAS domain S-box protein [Halosimplex pelagicum]QLH80229.1 PAS domain S-box protein [Halosimplex pelagicum]
MSATPTTIRVLHVDDDPDLSALVASALEREDDRFEVVTATNPDEGLERLAGERVDCVVSDYDMPGTNGIEFLERVRADRPDLPFILYTGKGSEEVASDAVSAGVTDYLQKGTGTDQYALLANRIDNAVSAARSRRALEERNRRLETLISNLPGIVYRCENDPGWPMEFVAGECAAITGYDAAALESGEVNWGEDVLHPDDRERMWETVQSALSDGGPFEVTYRIRTADGDVRWMWERGRAIGDDGGGTGGDGGSADRIEGFITDVTERREREQTLERYRSMVDAMPHSACIYDADGRFAVVNDHLADFLGTTPANLEGAKSSLVEEIRAGADGDPFRALVDGEREELRGEVEARFPEYGRAVVDYRLARLEIGGEFDGVVAVARDVTERRERERELAATSARLEALVGNSPDMIHVLDPDGRIVDANPRLCDALNRGEDDLLGTPVWEVDETVDPDVVRSLLDGMAVGESRKFDGRYRRADGSTFPVEINLVRVDLGGADRYLAISRDITERKRREDALAGLTDATEGFMDAPDPGTVAEHAVETARSVLGRDVNGVWLADDAGERLRPVVQTEAADALFDEMPTFDGEGEGSLAWEAFETGDLVVCGDLADEPERYNPDTPLSSEIVLPLGEYGVAVVGSTDPADFDEVDVSLAHVFASTVEAALDRAAREDESRRHRRELERQNERLDEFASIVSHDLRNPLQVATARLDFVREECDSDHLDAVERAHDRMEALIEDLLTLGREGKAVLDIEPVDLDAAARSCWRSVRTPEATLAVETDAAVRADRSRLQQLLENLLANAVEHSSTSPRSHAREDTVKHGSTTAQPQAREDSPDPGDPATDGSTGAVTVRVGRLDDGSGFFVADDGPGIDEADRDRVFSSGYSTAAEGTGFGLSIVEQIAEAHGWSVGVVESEAGGARFEIRGVETDA